MKKIPLDLGRHTLVDDADYDWLSQYMWCRNNKGYVINAVNYSRLCDAPISSCSLMHRLILGLELGDDQKTDHINHNILDNRRCNIRICTSRQSAMNRKQRADSSSQFKGVRKRNRKWYAYITIDGLRKFLGSFSKEKYAAQAYNLAAKRYFGEFAFLNKIP